MKNVRLPSTNSFLSQYGRGYPKGTHERKNCKPSPDIRCAYASLYYFGSGKFTGVLILLFCFSLSACGKKAPLSPPLSQEQTKAWYTSPTKAAPAVKGYEGYEELISDEMPDNSLFPAINRTITRSDEKKFPKPVIPKEKFILDPLLN